MFAVLRVLAIVGAVSGTASADDKRAIPDYDGRGNVDADDDGSAALWIPRVALFPLYAVHEYVIRAPLGLLARTAERDHWTDRVRRLVTFGPDQRDYLIPTAAYEFGLLPSVGLFLSTTGVGAESNELRTHVATWGPDWLTGTVEDQLWWNDKKTSLLINASAVRRPDHLFLGLGPDVTDATASRYGEQRLDVHAQLQHLLGGESKATVSAGAEHTSFREGECCSDPTLDARIADGSLAMPPGYADYSTLYQRASLLLDSRRRRPAPGTGGYLELHGQTNVDVANDRRWIDYGGTVGAAVDVDGHQRTLKLEVAADLVDPVRGIVPFDQLASLGPTLMPGFITGWMIGRSTLATQLSYTWPVSPWFDAELRVAVGNAFDEHLDQVPLQKLRLSGEVGVTTVSARDHGFELAFGLGTETIEQGANITSVRFAARTRWGL